MGDLGPDVDGPMTPFERVEILGEGLPFPLDALGQRSAGDVLDPFHEPDQPVVAVGPGGGEAHAAVAHHERVTPCHDDGASSVSQVA